MGCLNERPRGVPEHRFALHGECGASTSKNSKEDLRHVVPGHPSSSFGRPNNFHVSRSQRSHLPNGFSGLSGPLETSITSTTMFADKKDVQDQSNRPIQLLGSTFNQLDVDNASSTYKRNKIIYSGPLIPMGDNIEEMLREHERQIEQAVRKACIDRTMKKCVVKSQSEAQILTGKY
ncbi:putative serine/threonine-protein kinase [Platanthera guangdongensis]|uniref:Serine/threonine-protein kinase n=1 Tax=Platanthera guangdongensis TaxID=2320717 RepID=A0ABR2MTS2_9ASPA